MTATPNDQPTFGLSSRGLLSRFGFSDGNRPEELHAHLVQAGVSPDLYWHPVLVALVRTYLLPQLPGIHTSVWRCAHNPIRAVNPGKLETRPPVTVEVPWDAVVEACRQFGDSDLPEQNQSSDAADWLVIDLAPPGSWLIECGDGRQVTLLIKANGQLEARLPGDTQHVKVESVATIGPDGVAFDHQLVEVGEALRVDLTAGMCWYFPPVLRIRKVPVWDAGRAVNGQLPLPLDCEL